jgi:GntR family transcriptional regulator, arabinose operon transcriptional repressor
LGESSKKAGSGGRERKRLHEVVREKILAWIAQEGVRAHEALPAEMRMCEMFGVSRITVRHAVLGLVKEGVLVRKPGVGTFVGGGALAGEGQASLAGTVVLVVCNRTGSFMGNLIAGVEEGVRKLGLELSVQVSDDDVARERGLVELAIARRAAGVILFPVDSDEAYHPNCFTYLKLVEAGIAVVFVDRYLSQLPIGYVVAGDEEGMAAVTEHMIEEGYRDIGYIDHAINATSVIDRRRGFEETMRRAGLKAGVSLTIQAARPSGKKDEDLAYEAVKGKIKEGKLPRAWVTCNSFYALGAYWALKEKGIRVPEDVALAGFEDLQEAMSLTGWRAPTVEMGRQAAEAVGRLMKEPKGDVPRLKVAGEVVVRGSSRKL